MKAAVTTEDRRFEVVELPAAGTPDKRCHRRAHYHQRERQHQRLLQAHPELVGKVIWADSLPDELRGVIVGNEVLDAMPVHGVHWTDAGIAERGVTLDADGHFAWAERPADAALAAAATALPVAAPYVGEIGLAGRAWTAEWAHRLEQGALLLIDYGLPRHEYYHPQRHGGTVRCHYRRILIATSCCIKSFYY